MTKVIESFGDRVRKTREARGMSASDLARLTNVTPTAVWNWENKNRTPQAKTLGTLATVLNVAKEWLLTGAGSMGNEPSTPATAHLSAYSLEELIAAIDRKGFAVSVSPKVG